FRGLGINNRLAGDLGSATLLVVLTVVTLVVSNVVPKQVGFVRANEVAIAAARPMWLWIHITAPIGWIVLQTSRVVAKLLGAKPDQPHRVTEQDILHLIDEGAKRGGLDASETAMVKRVLALSDIQASQLMTKVDAIEWIDPSDDSRQVTKEIERSSHSFFPVAEGSLDSLKGILKAKDWLALDSPTFDRIELMPAVFVKPDSSLIDVLHALAPVDTKAAFVRKKDGSIVGMISLNDAVQAVTGPLKGA
ncbi:MAG TPA: CNNM domain-containing protein, partial [Fimbriimonadaceae bacterium]|nr:CNNM domain-containing protein [Fimbriimonadaceae bacterium]